CDAACKIFNDCCDDLHDFCSFTRPLILNNTDKYECVRVSPQQRVHLLAGCNADFTDQEMVKACEEPSGQTKNPLYITPVTDNSTGLSYKNIFCANCNKIKSEYMVFWRHTIECSAKYYQSSAEVIQVDNITSDSLWQAVFDNSEKCQVNLTIEDTSTFSPPLRGCRPSNSCDEFIPPFAGVNGYIAYLGFEILMDVTSSGKIKISNRNFLGVVSKLKSLDSECTLDGCHVVTCPHFYILQDGRCVYNELLVKIKYEMKVKMKVQSRWLFHQNHFTKGEMLPVFGDGIPVFGVPEHRFIECKNWDKALSLVVCEYEFYINYKMPKSLSQIQVLNILENNMLVVHDSMQRQVIEGTITTRWTLIDIVNPNELFEFRKGDMTSLDADLSLPAGDLSTPENDVTALDDSLGTRGRPMTVPNAANNQIKTSKVLKSDSMKLRKATGTLLICLLYGVKISILM
ncbi:unnamed protein product, partial [Owenia fusiformis]